jgi:cytochrome c oxidase subunit III
VSAPSSHGGHPSLQHHFDSLEQQKSASSMGIWLFLVTEVLFFGGVMTAYVVYRSMHAHAFVEGSSHLDILLGGINTGVLILSSLTMALAVWSAQGGRQKMLQVNLVLTMALGLVFLGIKAVEYSQKFEHHLVPGPHFRLEGSAPEVELFFSIYFLLTGIHAFHMVIGIGLLSVMFVQARRGRYSAEYHNPVEVSGLYWHFVDIVWIFLFPLLYLIGRHGI